MAQGGYSGQKPTVKQAQQRESETAQRDAQRQRETDDMCNKRIAEMHEQFEIEARVLRSKLAQVESERVMLLRILDAYAIAVTELRECKTATAMNTQDFMALRGGTGT